MPITKKQGKEIHHRLYADILSLKDIAEFDFEGKMFENEPAYWTELEKNLCDYQARIGREIIAMLQDVLKFPFIKNEENHEPILQ